MIETTAVRTLVKSPPELWEACSDPASLTRHLGDVGPVTITALNPETAVAWEGERMSGTVRIEPAGWGTRVTLTAGPRHAEAVTAEMTALRAGARGYRHRRGLLGRLLDGVLGSLRPALAESAGPAVAEAASLGGPAPAPADPDPGAALEAALESLGQAHRRPFSRG